MASSYKLYCPHCQSKIAERFSHSLHRTGDPRMKCPKCGKTCIDTFCDEPAFSPFLDHSLVPSSIFKLLLALMLCVAVTLLIGWLALRITIHLTVLLIFFGLCLLVSGFFFLNRNRSERRDFDLWLASNQRLSNPEYAYSLYLLGYPVPPYYLPTFEARTQKTIHAKPVLLRTSSGLDSVPPPQSSKPRYTSIPTAPSKKDHTAVRYDLRCPYCGHLLGSKSFLKFHSGKILNACPLCSKIYADPYGIETALEEYKPSSFFKQALSSLFAGFGLAVILAVNVIAVTGNEPFTGMVLGFGTAVFWMYWIVLDLVRRRKSKQQYQKLRNESDRRLRDPSYAYLLKQAGYYIPSRYLPSYYESQALEPFSPRPLRITRTDDDPTQHHQ